MMIQKKGFLARATTYSYDVGLTSLKVGINGDYTVKSSDELYTSDAMQHHLITAYENHCIDKKTLIFIRKFLKIYHLAESILMVSGLFLLEFFKESFTLFFFLKRLLKLLLYTTPAP